MKGIRFLGYVLFAATQISSAALAADPASAPSSAQVKFPVLANAVTKLDPANEADQEQIRALVGDDRFHAIQKDGHPIYLESKRPVGHSTGAEIAGLIREMRDSVCSVLRETDQFQFTATWDASAELWGVGTSGSTGITVTIKCGK